MNRRRADAKVPLQRDRGALNGLVRLQLKHPHISAEPIWASIAHIGIGLARQLETAVDHHVPMCGLQCDEACVEEGIEDA